MEIKLLGALDYDKLGAELKNKNVENVSEIIDIIKENEIYERTHKVSSAGRLSRFPGDVFEILGITNENSFEKNVKFAKTVTGMGHDSIADHDYLVFAIKDVSPVIEQTIIAERFSSFTIKSRREVDFSKVGYFTPYFRDDAGNILDDNHDLRIEYNEYMQTLFNKYAEFVDKGVTKEDARFVLPYCYYSNIIMGVDAHTLRDMIIKYTKGHLSEIQELRTFGNYLYSIAKKNCPYIIDAIDNAPIQECDPVLELLNYSSTHDSKDGYKVLDKPKLLNRTNNVDNTILISAIMSRYQVSIEQANEILNRMEQNDPSIKEKLMRKIVFESEGIELKQVNFQYQIPLSFSVLTHLTRHRTHPIMVPEFAPNVDLLQYKLPPKIKALNLDGEFQEVFERNNSVYKHFLQDYNICQEDLVYFTLSGNIVNIVTNFDGKTLEHILGLRECTKAQWETRDMAYGIHEELKGAGNEDVKIFQSLLGPTCETQGYCKEGKESCGRIKALKKEND